MSRCSVALRAPGVVPSADRACSRELAHDGPFDFTFIDADKPNIPEYFDWAVRLTRPRGVIIVDNVVRQGAVIDSASTDENVRGVRRFHEALATDTRVSATTIQTVGSKGHDGFTIALVN